mmetsp:Transcript_38367/g.109639  ORF Transcript_38367/g.109639 Transcript_38367/m.109639 type:complete len:84 (-) Transcript_38367:1775-2026(-)
MPRPGRARPPPPRATRRKLTRPFAHPPPSPPVCVCQCKHEIAYALSEACGRPAPRNLSDVAFSDLLLHHLLTEIAPKGRMPDE